MTELEAWHSLKPQSHLQKTTPPGPHYNKTTQIMAEKEPEQLKYNILGEDNASPQDKIAKYTGDVDWNYLKPHFKSGAMIYVDPELPLKEVAQAFTDDNKAQVQAWLKSADLVKPSPLHQDWWEHDQTRFTAVVITPFVLAQPLKKETP